MRIYKIKKILSNKLDVWRVNIIIYVKVDSCLVSKTSLCLFKDQL